MNPFQTFPLQMKQRYKKYCDAVMSCLCQCPVVNSDIVFSKDNAMHCKISYGPFSDFSPTFSQQMKQKLKNYCNASMSCLCQCTVVNSDIVFSKDNAMHCKISYGPFSDFSPTFSQQMKQKLKNYCNALMSCLCQCPVVNSDIVFSKDNALYCKISYDPFSDYSPTFSQQTK